MHATLAILAALAVLVPLAALVYIDCIDTDYP